MTKGISVALCAVLLLAACHGNESNQAPAVGVSKLPTKSTAQVKRGPTPEELTAGMVEAVGVGKSAVPVALKFEVPTRPEVGQPLELVLAVLPQEPATATSVKLTGSAGLQPPTGDGVVEIGAVDPAEVYRVSVTVTPIAIGVQFLAVDVSLKRDNVTDTRSFYLPIIVQGAAEEPTGAPVPVSKP